MVHSKGANQRSLMSGQFVKEQVGLRSVGVGVGKSRPECLGDRASWSLKTERRREVTSKEHPSQERAGRVSGRTFSIPPALFWGLPLAESTRTPRYGPCPCKDSLSVWGEDPQVYLGKLQAYS